MDFISLYNEGGMVAVVGAMFMFLVYSLNKRSSEQASTLEDLKIENKGQSETLENMEGMIIKLIERWNKSDEKLDRKFDDLNRHVRDLDSQASEIKGNLSRLNGKH
jgi:flagellar capping protein FliD|tara:strand:+ start:1024 stop:1341 length:318 start_codon:yes stop_codon:yes gene_type:complete